MADDGPDPEDDIYADDDEDVDKELTEELKARDKKTKKMAGKKQSAKKSKAKNKQRAELDESDSDDDLTDNEDADSNDEIDDPSVPQDSDDEDKDADEGEDESDEEDNESEDDKDGETDIQDLEIENQDASQAKDDEEPVGADLCKPKTKRLMETDEMNDPTIVPPPNEEKGFPTALSEISFEKDEDRITLNRLTIYETTRIIGTRVTQLSNRAKPMLKNTDELSFSEIAKQELSNRVLPFILVRPLPNNKFEKWKLNEMEIDMSILDSIS